MTADVVPLGRKPRVVVVKAERESLRPPDPRRDAIEQCADRIERRLGERLTLDQRIGLEHALDELADEIAGQRSRVEPW